MTTGEDNFCCKDSGSQPVEKPQDPLFRNQNNQPYPCMDQTSLCKKWIETNPESCSPDYASEETYSYKNSYMFMREVCQESCSKLTNNFRSNKCQNVSEYFLL